MPNGPGLPTPLPAGILCQCRAKTTMLGRLWLSGYPNGYIATLFDKRGKQECRSTPSLRNGWHADASEGSAKGIPTTVLLKRESPTREEGPRQ